MRHLQTYITFEREDISRNDKINEIVYAIINIIQNHINECMKMNYDDFLDNVYKMKYEDITINIGYNNNISYAKNHDGDYFLFLGLDSIQKLIEKIKEQKQKNIEVEPINNLYDELTTYERMAITHEIVHKMDDGIFDMFKDYMLKIFNTDDINKVKEMQERDLENKYMKKI